MNEQKTCRHNCAKYDVAEPKNCYKNLQCAKQDGCKIPTSQGINIKMIQIFFTKTYFNVANKKFFQFRIEARKAI